MSHMVFHKEYLDLVLVPVGLLIMFLYHILILHRYLNYPYTTFIGLENKDKCDWVQSVVEGGDRGKDLDRAVNVISSNTTAATYLATISLTLTSLIGTWLASSSSASVFQSQRIYGDTRPSTIFIKNVCLLSCFLLAFSGFVHAARHLIHANYLISSTDNKKLVKQAQFAITKGNNYWLFGLRALYFALNIILWFFGPAPMLASSVIMVIVLYYHDIYTVKLHDDYCLADNYKVRKASSDGSFSY